MISDELTKRNFQEEKEMRRAAIVVCVIMSLILASGFAFGQTYPKEIRIGLSTALSGGWAGFGAKPAGGFKVAIEQINALGRDQEPRRREARRADRG